MDRERDRAKNRIMEKENEMDRDRNCGWCNKRTGTFTEKGK